MTSPSRRRTSRRGAFVLAGCLLLPGVAGKAAADGRTVEDPRFGFKFRAPSGWTPVPIKPEEKWIVAKFLCDQLTADRKTGYTLKPEMNVIVFTEEAKNRREGQVEKRGDVTFISVENPYKDYRDYLKRNLDSGGWYFSKEEKGTIDGVEVEYLEAKIEKLTYGGARRVIGWVFHREDADFACHVEVLEDSYDRLKNVVEGAFKSFRFIARTEAAPSQVTTGKSIVEKEDEDKLTPSERRERRIAKQERFVEKASKALPKGWSVIRYPRVIVLSHVDRKIADFVADQATAVLDWLEVKFGSITQEYVRTPVIRICKDDDEERAYNSGSSVSWWGSDDMEFTTNGGPGIWYRTKWINGRITAFWFSEKDNDLAYAMPRWLREGLDEYLSGVTAKGKKLIFTDAWAKQDVAAAAKSGNLRSPRDLMVSEVNWSSDMKDTDFQSMMADSQQSAFLVRYLLDGAGQRGRTKDLILRYIGTWRGINARIQKEREEKAKAEPARAADPEPQTEEEEEELMRKKRQERHTVIDDGRKQIAQETLDKVFEGWEDKDWKAFENGFKASVKK